MTINKIKYPALAVLWLINPVFNGCDTQEFTFGEEDMLGLMDSINLESWSLENNDREYELEFSLSQVEGEQASLSLFELMATASACDERSFLAQASACMDVTTMPIEGTVTIIDKSSQSIVIEDLPVEGSMDVNGHNLTNADLSLFSDTTSIYFYSDDGESFSLSSAYWEE